MPTLTIPWVIEMRMSEIKAHQKSILLSWKFNETFFSQILRVFEAFLLLWLRKDSKNESLSVRLRYFANKKMTKNGLHHVEIKWVSEGECCVCIQARAIKFANKLFNFLFLTHPFYFMR